MEEAVKMLLKARHAMAFTGAGVSTESGIPDFRGSSGLWERYPVEKVASRRALMENPAFFLNFYRERFKSYANVKPNRAHEALARMEKAGIIKGIVTQNIDGLHQKAGSKNVIEIHGTLKRVRCDRCGKYYLPEKLDEEEVPRCNCGGVIRPDVVLFGEALPRREWQMALELAECSDLVLVVGSSLVVTPANQIPGLVLLEGGKAIIVNKDPTPLDDQALVLRGYAGEILSKLAEMLGV
ncbi:NAD-dependent deacetylase [Carboxydothermus islandicus]|uniref:NAD-dependent protein deacetylase n=1 Tax=Carboxydothermus islandicus TaxID=661089 RepID=A0A1L8D0S3_9THEO|nr:NAD-dependent deacylase [Carboxydothermus islandicus]GAV24727.1 NAD-dependent deacetylase [Carboxydothermus islandicus]